MNPGKMRLGRDRWGMQWLRAMSGNGSRDSRLAHCFTNDHGCRQNPRRIGRRQRLRATRRRIRTTGVGAENGHCHGRLLHRLLRGRCERRPQRGKIDGNTCQRETPQPFLKRGDAVLAFAVKADGTVRAIAENASNQIGQHTACADFNKAAHTTRIHGLDLLDESYRLGKLRGDLFADCRRFLGIG